MKRLFAIIAAVFAITLLGAPQQTTANETTSTQSPRILSSAYYSGIIGKNLGVTVYLEHYTNGEYYGWYYYNKNGSNNKLRLEGRKCVDGTVELVEYTSNGQVTAAFAGTFNNYGQFIGTMYVGHSDKYYSCKLTPIR